MRDQLRKINDHSFELPKTGKMNVPGKIYSSENLLSHPGMSSAIKQVADVATLPGIVDSSLAMPDIHWGYGFPIGGVAAFRTEKYGENVGVISPGGVGFDINCGVRVLALDATIDDVPNIKKLAGRIAGRIPAGASGKGGLDILSLIHI